MLTEWEKNDAERKSNIERYGVNESDVTIATRVAYEATDALAQSGWLKEGCSELAQKWHAHHRRLEDDKDNVVAEREARDRLRQATITKLSPQELEALGVKA